MDPEKSTAGLVEMAQSIPVEVSWLPGGKIQSGA